MKPCAVGSDLSKERHLYWRVFQRDTDYNPSPMVAHRKDPENKKSGLFQLTEMRIGNALLRGQVKLG
jgi:hypothetical protein